MRTGRGLSELAGAVILIAITLIAGVALYGFYFSGHGVTPKAAASKAASVVNSVGGNPANSFYATAQVSATQVSCSSADGSCSMLLINTGSANTDANGCSFGALGQGVLSPEPVTVTAGESVQVTCTTSTGQGGGAGTLASGSVYLGNGAVVDWTGTWQ